MNASLLSLTPAQFCLATGACSDGRRYARTQSSMADVWDNCPHGVWLAWMLQRIGGHDAALRLFACACVRQTPLVDGRAVWDLLSDQRSRDAVDVAERFARGEASDSQRRAAADVADAAACAACAPHADASKFQADLMRRLVPNPFRK